MSHKCFSCSTYIGDDRFICCSCLKTSQESLFSSKTGQDDFGVSETDFMGVKNERAKSNSKRPINHFK